MIDRFTTALALGLALGSLTASPASAQENETIKSILNAVGLGGDEDKEPIIYRERAPLVLPPKNDLRQPLPAAETLGQRNAAWPNDPANVERRKREAEKRRPAGTSEKNRMLDDHGTRLTRAELEAGDRRTTVNESGPARQRLDRGRDDSWVHPDVLKSQGRLSDTLVAAGEEPPRQALTQPPTGFRSSALPVKREFGTATRDEYIDSARTFNESQQRR